MKGLVVWATGLPASGKSTFSERLAARLRADDRACCVLDGDALRAALRPVPGYSDEARDDFYATLAHLAALLANQGLIVLVAATAHRRRYRRAARQAAPAFIEIHMAAPVEECGARDQKGLYSAARSGEVGALPGVGVDYEPPEAPDLVARGGDDEVALERALRAVIDRLEN
jgi:adenylylsulfate kinase